MIILKFVWRRLLTAFFAVMAVLMAAFLLVRLTPNPVALIAGPEATAEQLRMVQKQLGLDKSVQIVSLSAKDSDLVNMAAIAAFNISG